jgi:hypothetical protein
MNKLRMVSVIVRGISKEKNSTAELRREGVCLQRCEHRVYTAREYHRLPSVVF